MTYLLQSTNLSQLKKDKHRRTNTEGQTQKDKHSEKVNIGYIILSKSRHFVYARSLKPYPKTVSME